MSVIRTDQWLLDSYEQPIKLCEKLEIVFNHAQAYEIYDYLTQHGMYRPFENGVEQVRRLKENKLWERVQDEEEELQSMWEGPDVPVFIFPSDPHNQKLARDTDGKSGLAFQDKLFLFVPIHSTEMQIRALFTHEYNHVCRLTKYEKNERDYSLLDTIVLEGLAENAVRERFGQGFLASWTANYPENDLETLWNGLVRPNSTLSKTNPKYHEILYGLNPNPKMAGYGVGYYLVKKHLDANESTVKDLLPLATDKIVHLI